MNYVFNRAWDTFLEYLKFLLPFFIWKKLFFYGYLNDTFTHFTYIQKFFRTNLFDDYWNNSKICANTITCSTWIQYIFILINEKPSIFKFLSIIQTRKKSVWYLYKAFRICSTNFNYTKERTRMANKELDINTYIPHKRCFCICYSKKNNIKLLIYILYFTMIGHVIVFKDMSMYLLWKEARFLSHSDYQLLLIINI